MLINTKQIFSIYKTVFSAKSLVLEHYLVYTAIIRGLRPEGN